MAALLLSVLDCEASVLGLLRGRGTGEPAVKVPELVPLELVLTWPEEELLLLEPRPLLRMHDHRQRFMLEHCMPASSTCEGACRTAHTLRR